MEVDPAGGDDLPGEVDDLGVGGGSERPTDRRDSPVEQQEITRLVATAGRVEEVSTAQEQGARHRSSVSSAED